MIPFFILLGAGSKFLNLRLRARRRELEVQKNLMGDGNNRQTHPSEVRAI